MREKGSYALKTDAAKLTDKARAMPPVFRRLRASNGFRKKAYCRRRIFSGLIRLKLCAHAWRCTTIWAQKNRPCKVGSLCHESRFRLGNPGGKKPRQAELKLALEL